MRELKEAVTAICLTAEGMCNLILDGSRIEYVTECIVLEKAAENSLCLLPTHQ